MRRWQEVKEDYPFMASEREPAQSEFTCIASRRKCVSILSDIVLIVFIVSGKINHLVLLPFAFILDVQEAMSGTIRTK
jgi:hypothetical protein